MKLQLNNTHLRHAAHLYLACFLLTTLWNLYYGITFTQLAPPFFTAQLDLTGHLILGTGITNLIINYSWFRLLFDVLYYIFPIALIISFSTKKTFLPIVAIACFLFNMLYGYTLSIFTYISTQTFTAWFFFPLLFISRKPLSFYYNLHMLRYAFLIIFASTGLWKFRSGGVFYPEQMSGILLLQHAALLVDTESNYFSNIITYLITHPDLSRLLYLFAASLEVFFLIGLFTQKIDRYLLALFLMFLVSNYLLMQINYLVWLPFVLCLWYSRFKPVNG